MGEARWEQLRGWQGERAREGGRDRCGGASWEEVGRGEVCS